MIFIYIICIINGLSSSHALRVTRYALRITHYALRITFKKRGVDMTDKTDKFITASLMFSLLGTGSYASLADKPAAAQIIAKNEEISADKIYQTEEWEKIAKKWNAMDKVKVKNFEEISKTVEKAEKIYVRPL